MNDSQGYAHSTDDERSASWQIKELGEVVTFKNGERPDLSPNGKYPVYGANGIMGNSDSYLVDKPQVLVIGRVGAPGEVHLTTGKVCVSDNALYISAFVQEAVDLRFLLHKLRQVGLRRYATQTTHPMITQTTVSRIKVVLPPLPEQKKIDEVLSAVDDGIATTDEIIAKTQQLKKGLMHQLLTRGIGHTKFKQTEIGEIPEDSEIKTLREIVFDVKDGASLKPEDFAGSGFPVLHKGDIKRDGVIEIGKTNPFCKEEVAKKSESSIIDDSFLVVTLRERSWDGIDVIGTIAHSDGTYLLTQGAYAFHCKNDKVDPRFLVYLSNSTLYRRCMRSITIGSAQIHIRMREFLDTRLPFPPLKEQQTIASILFSAHEKIRKEKLYTHSLERLKEGLMQVLLTGKVRVKVN